jgi:DNA-binding CsgD family transcriptional regulator
VYINLRTAYEAQIFAEQVNKAPPVWTKTAGLSAEFIAKFGITGREREIVNNLLEGKSDKDIAVALNIAVSTAQTHLKNIYKKTGVSGRFALQALLRS